MFGGFVGEGWVVGGDEYGDVWFVLGSSEELGWDVEEGGIGD